LQTRENFARQIRGRVALPQLAARLPNEISDPTIHMIRMCPALTYLGESTQSVKITGPRHLSPGQVFRLGCEARLHLFL